MSRDLDAGVKLLFPQTAEQIQQMLEPLRDERAKWAVLALSDGDLGKLRQHLEVGLRDRRDVLVGAENMSPDPKGGTVRRLPAAEELEFRLLATKLQYLGFFDRSVRSGAAVVNGPNEPDQVAAALTERMARGFGPVSWREVPMDTASFLLLHVMNRSFAPEEVARAPHLLGQFLSFADPKRALASALPEELPIEPDGRPRRGPRNYAVGVVLIGQIRTWGLWMEHENG